MEARAPYGAPQGPRNLTAPLAAWLRKQGFVATEQVLDTLAIVRALDVDILCRLARLNPVWDKALLLTPLAQFGADKFWAVVAAQLRGSAVALD